MPLEHSPETIAKQIHAAKAIGRSRKATILIALRRAMRGLATEIRGNGGMLPKTSGSLTIATVCRRAEVSNVVFNPEYAKAKSIIKNWISRWERRAQTASFKARRSRASRLAEWKALCDDQEAVIIRDGDLYIEERRLRLEAEAEVASLQAQIAKLVRNNVAVLRSIPGHDGS